MSRGSGQRQKLEHAVAAIQARYGNNALRSAKEIVHNVPHISTGFAALDGLTGCGGVPLGAMTLLSGVRTSGKESISYKALAAAQAAYPKQFVALATFHGEADADYLRRSGVALERLFVYEPAVAPNVVDALVAMANRRNVRLIVANALVDLQSDRSTFRHLTSELGRLNQALRDTNTALIWIDDPAPPWMRWLNWDDSYVVRQYAALHLEMRLEQLLHNKRGEMVGYTSIAKLHKSRWTKCGREIALNIEFNGTIKAREAWA